MIVQSPRPVFEIEIAHLKDHEIICNHFLADWEEMAIDLGFPIIVADTQIGPMIIDGWHRVRLALNQGMNQLFAVFLSSDETNHICKIRSFSDNN